MISTNGDDKDITILELKILNYELAMEHMELQRQNLAFKIGQFKLDHAKLKAELEEKAKEKSNGNGVQLPNIE